MEKTKRRDKTKRRGFVYKPRTKEQIGARAKQQGGMFDSSYKPNVQTFAPKEGDHRIRIMPPTWDDAEHYGFDVWLHSSVGPDNQTYLCLSKMKDEPCPVCEEQQRAAREGDQDYSNKLKPYRRVAVWCIARDRAADGPLLYPMPWTMDRDITNLSIEKDTGDVLCVDDPEEGWDVEFSREGSGLKTKYHGVQIARRSTPLLPDEDERQEALEFILANPIPETLNFYDYAHIAKVFAGAPKSDDDEDDEDEDDEDDEVVTRASAKKKKAKAHVEVEEDDEDEDEEEDDDEDDEIDDEDQELDDDEDEDDEVEEDDDDEDKPPAKAAKKKAKARVQVEEDDDDGEDEDEDEDEDDEPAPPKRSKLKDKVRAQLQGKGRVTRSR